jgi:hypothetical protein
VASHSAYASFVALKPFGREQPNPGSASAVVGRESQPEGVRLRAPAFQAIERRILRSRTASRSPFGPRRRAMGWSKGLS